MRRRLLNLAATMSLVLCVAVAGIWIWSYPATPGVVHERPGRTSVVAAYRGRLLFETVGQNDVSVWPGVGGRMRLVTPWSQVLYLDAPDALPAPVFGFQRYTKTSRGPSNGSHHTILVRRRAAPDGSRRFVGARPASAPTQQAGPLRLLRLRPRQLRPLPGVRSGSRWKRCVTQVVLSE